MFNDWFALGVGLFASMGTFLYVCDLNHVEIEAQANRRLGL